MLLVGLLCVTLLAAPVFVTPGFVELYRSANVALPIPTRLAIGRWAPRLCVVPTGGLALAGVLVRAKMGRARALIVAGFALGLLCVGLYLWALYLPIFGLAEAVQ